MKPDPLKEASEKGIFYCCACDNRDTEKGCGHCWPVRDMERESRKKAKAADGL